MRHPNFRRIRGSAAAGLGLVLALAVLAPTAGAQGGAASEVETLRKQIAALSGQGRYAEAIPLALQVAEIRKKTQGESAPAYADALAALGNLYYEAGEPG